MSGSLEIGKSTRDAKMESGKTMTESISLERDYFEIPSEGGPVIASVRRLRLGRITRWSF